jgi:phage tail sheath protein FI
MATLSYPGVYVVEVPSAVHTITGVATSVAAFVGWAAQGPVNQAVLIESFMDFQRQFGGLDARSLLGYAVSHFFTNGGQQAYIVRLSQAAAATGTTATTATAAGVTMTVAGGALAWAAKSTGASGNGYGILVSASTGTTFNGALVYAPTGRALTTVETYTGVNAATPGAIKSNFVTLKATGTPTAAPANGLYMLTGGSDGNGIGVPGAATASLVLNAAGSTNSGFTITAQNPGSWGNLIAVGATPQPGDATGMRFSLNVVALNASGNLSVVESYNNLSVLASDPNYAVTVLNTDSNYIAVSALGVPTAAPNSPFPPSGAATTPFAAGQFLSGGTDGIVLDPTQDGANGGLFMTALNSDGTGTGGVHLLDRVDAFNLLCVPGESQAAVIANLQQYCSTQRAFYIVDCPPSATASGLTQTGPAGNGTGSLTGQYSANAAYYFPWVQAPDPLVAGRPRYFPPCGFIAGIYATTDSTRGVWKAPAGIDASLTGVTGLAYTLTDIENGSLNTQGINCLRAFKVYGDVVWGSRTLQGGDQAGSQWKYVPIRRLALFIESSLLEGTQWVVFEPNDQNLWSQIRLNLGAFMQGLFLEGAFQGTSPQQAYFVKCDAENNPQSSIDLGIVNILVGFAPLYPAEFVVIQIQQMAGQTQS